MEQNIDKKLKHQFFKRKDTVNAYLMNGVINSMMHNYQTAIMDYDSCITKNKDDAFAYFNRAATRTKLEETIYDELRYSNSITISRSNFQSKEPTNQIPLPNYKKLIEDYDTVIHLNPKLAYAYYNRGNLYLKMKKFNEAIDQYTKALSIEPHLAEAYYNRALILLYLKQNEKACKDLSKAGEMGVNDAYNVIKRYCTKN